MSESDPTTYVLPQGYQFVDENGNVINATKITLEKKKPIYPKTYEECCTILGFHYDHYLTYDDEKNIPVSQDESDFIDAVDAFAKLIICRNAYWKIYGEENGLGKPWELDWRKVRYIIYRNQDDIIRGYREEGCAEHHILSFPTAEMRDAFYEAFKKEIEMCKKFL